MKQNLSQKHIQLGHVTYNRYLYIYSILTICYIDRMPEFAVLYTKPTRYFKHNLFSITQFL